MKVKVFIAIFVLSVVVSFSLLFLTLYIPYLVNKYLERMFPDITSLDPVGRQAREEFINRALPIGTILLIILAVIIVLGFLVNKGLLYIGSIGFYLPVFGSFAFTMFFLAGIGVLRVLWLPLYIVSPYVLKLGHIVLAPMLFFLVVMFFMPQLRALYTLMELTILAIMYTGILVFTLGVFTWIYWRIEGKPVIDYWIYKYSRHPQYLGYLLWSYGLLCTTGWSPYDNIIPSLPWLISAILVISKALLEEIDMVRKHGDTYLDYRRKTPFLLPLPRILSRAITYPARRILGKRYPENTREVALVAVTYTILLIILSFPLVYL